MQTSRWTERLAIVVVSYNRAQLLDELLESIAELPEPPRRVVVVDNASTDSTPDVLRAWSDRLGDDRLLTHRMTYNSGGAGGFSEGTRIAMDLGCEWIWLMDDDVELLPDALTRLSRWVGRFKMLHGRRYDVDGSPFYWQARFNQTLGIPLPYTMKAFNRCGYAVTDSGTFEGMLVHADVVRTIGLPDPRFFISWDDAVYAWLAARTVEVAYVDEFVLRRKRCQRQISLGVRHLNDSSPLARYHVMRNRAYVGRYFSVHGGLHHAGFAVGTALTFGKEVLRLIAVERTGRGISELVRGWRDGRAIWQDRSWRPMPPFEPVRAAVPVAARAGGIPA